MWEFLTTPAARVIMSVSFLLALIVIGFYLVRRFGDRTGEDHPDTHEHLTNFREMHQQGDIDEGEFRNIKTVLGAQLHSRTASDTPDPQSSEEKSDDPNLTS